MNRAVRAAPGSEVGARPVEIIVIGASAGAIEAISAILARLPADFAIPILIVIHLPADRRSLVAEVFQAKCPLVVKEADDKEPIRPGTVYVAPPDYHLLVEEDRRISLADDEPVLYSRPSIDVLFESAADAFGAAAMGIVLTGANSDGARGLRQIAERGGQTVVQQPATAYASAMPQAALELAPASKVLDLAEIPRLLNSLGGAA